MEPRDVKTLLLLEALDKKEYQSQRELSKKINISLGLVNTFIKNLTIRGLFRTVNLPGNKVKYILTPKGAIEKANLTRQYLSYSIRYYNEIKRRVSETLSLLEKNGKKDIVFYGTGELLEITCIILCENKNSNLKIIDNKKAGRKICGITIHEEAKLENLRFDAVVILDFDNISISREALMKKGVPPDKIFAILSRD
jgi:DNA-binding MarR family transcriptional regulator